jgi:hypothetical protein
MVNNLKKLKKKIISSAMLLTFSIAILVTVIFGWFTLSKNSTVSPLEILIRNKNTYVTIDVTPDEENENGYYFNEVCPGKEYVFTVTFINSSPTRSSHYNIYFSGLSDNLAENGVDLDMVGIFAVRVENQSLEYFREKIDLSGNVQVTSGQIPPLTETVLHFSLVFSDSYMDYVGEEKTLFNDRSIINQFQGKQFNIERLVVTAD